MIQTIFVKNFITNGDIGFLQSALGIAKCDMSLLESASCITKCDRLSLQSAEGIIKCNRLLVRQVLRVSFKLFIVH